ncbi:nucleotide sugar dehydrogenase [Ornithinibacillus halotolerans]|uniref:UDP-N-acetyl-D-galactosamine dehydrogenase n=1 Tax=Ornithinibacillus halotolerans TaxID=1274357 RepID=A0A916S020_9BACI|nr:nucleotide sugar dehydrogenase [Ornithinibacillus halotolerans]GGA75988.1 UDP-N-acetyl-D-galactosamine dehydrogenase [Ornithinibacillus halotolerans]
MRTRLVTINGDLENLTKEDLPVIGVVGLGYVGLPVSLGFSKRYQVIGYDINQERITSLKKSIDATNEVSKEELVDAAINFTTDEKELNSCDVIIVTVPTPLNVNNKPDLSYLSQASTVIGKNMKKDTIVIYESTVYPGTTEEVCIPILEENSNLKCGKEFHIGYSPERINPGDKTHTFFNTNKVVAAQDNNTLEEIFLLYQSVIHAQVYKASSIKVAEASKLVENTQRDFNIALMNELSLIFRQMGINTYDVLEAAKTKWNFIPFNPGLVGGHCIGVDPYYFIYKSTIEGYKPELIELARRLNERMSDVIVDLVWDEIRKRNLNKEEVKIGLLGLTFKENVPDIRNSKSIEIAKKLLDSGLDIYSHDPYIDSTTLFNEHGIKLYEWKELEEVNILIVAVPHQEYRDKGIVAYQNFFSDGEGTIIDIKDILRNRCFSKEINVITL